MNAIEVSHLQKHYGNIHAIDDLSFHMEEGELFGFLGVNGAGKSTTIQILCTLLQQDQGSVTIYGHPLSDRQSIRKIIGAVTQYNCLDDHCTVRENMMIRASLYGAKPVQMQARMDSLSDLFECKDLLNRRYGQLSGGQKRKCEIIASLLHDPKILFLDEPTTGLDPATRQMVWNCIERLRSQLHMSVFLTTHYMEEAALANHIAIIDHGQLLEYGTPLELKVKYGMDSLLLYPNEFSLLQNTLRESQIPYQVYADHFLIELSNTLDALPLLKKWHTLLHGFEVIQGTMDDVFLRVCKTSEQEVLL